MSATVLVEPTNNRVIEIKGVSPSRGTAVGLSWLDSASVVLASVSASASDQFRETKVTGSQYWEFKLEGHMDASNQGVLEMMRLRLWQIPTMFLLCGVVFFAISGYFLLQSVFDLGVASLGPGVTAVLAAIFSKMAGRTKK